MATIAEALKKEVFRLSAVCDFSRKRNASSSNSHESIPF
jgi:hypothetical protein